MSAFSQTQVPVKTQVAAAATGAVRALTTNPVLGSVVIATILWGDSVAVSAGTVTVQDANGNVFSQSLNSPANGDPTNAGLIYNFYLFAPANADKTITAAWSVAPNFAATLWVSEWGVSGGTAAFDDGQKGTGGPATAITTPSVTAPAAGDLLYGVCISDHQVSSFDSPWTQDQAGIANQFSEGIGHILSSALGATAVAATQNTSSAWASHAMAFSIVSTPSLIIDRPRGDRRPFPFLPGSAQDRRT